MMMHPDRGGPKHESYGSRSGSKTLVIRYRVVMLRVTPPPPQILVEDPDQFRLCEREYIISSSERVWIPNPQTVFSIGKLQERDKMDSSVPGPATLFADSYRWIMGSVPDSDISQWLSRCQ
jgi:hypothetical protein